MKYNSIFVRGDKVYFSSQTCGKYVDIKNPVTKSSRDRINLLAYKGKIVGRLLSSGLVVFRRP